MLQVLCGPLLVTGCSAPSVGGQAGEEPARGVAPREVGDPLAPPPIFCYWGERYAGPAYPWQTDCDTMGPLRFVGPNDYVPIAFPGGTSGLDADHPYTRCHFERLIEAGAPVAIMLTAGNAPITRPGVSRASPETLSVVMDLIDELGGSLDYVFLDLEGGRAETEHPEHGITVTIQRVVEMVRGHGNPRINDAWIGNYAWSATRFDRAMSFSSAAERGFAAEAYLASGANVAMPGCYGYSWRKTHTVAEGRTAVRRNLGGTGGDAGAFIEAAPTVRAALLWGSLERLSAAARSLPDGHLLIPWFSRFIAWTGYPIGEPDLPTARDCEALVVHARLRGAHSFMVLPSSYEAQDAASGKGGFRIGDGGVDNWRYRELVIGAWAALDADLADRPSREVLRLATDKSSGVMVSAMRFGPEVTVVVSNLSGERIEVDPGELLSVRFSGRSTVALDHGGHAIRRWSVDPAVRDFDGDGRLTRRDKARGEARISEAARSGRFEATLDIDGNGVVDLQDAARVRNAPAAYGPLPE